MTKAKTFLAVALFLAASALGTGSAGTDARAAQILKASREALGGDARLADLKSLVASGRHRRTRGETQLSGETEITIVFPDKYLRTQSDTILGNSVTREAGFSGDELVDRSQSLGNQSGGVVFRAVGPAGRELDPAARKAAMLRSQQAEFSRLLLGWLLAPPGFLEATVAYVGEAESPEGRAHVIEVKGRDDFAARIFIDPDTRRPLMLTHMAPQPMLRVVRADSGSPRAGASSEEIARQMRGQEPPPLVEHQWYFDDFRNVDGVWLPHRLGRAADGEPFEEIEFDRIRLDEPITPSVFDTK